MRHAQRALLILVEQMFESGHEMTAEQRSEVAALSHGEVKEVFRVFVRDRVGDEEIDGVERQKLLEIREQLRLDEIEFDRAA